ncbi:1-phosphatidylinositol 4,5-bisphosphate phosphodiesterase-like [Cloeon dipterum]|uniref:1-phosphatidylinositol 4,5-bisphosphate phosphodiesterase-like n=1 Tax=Cloeon dipterum TaxID=197152 RepID=UPI00321FD73D
MTKKYEFNWRIPVPDFLQQGIVGDRWTEEKESYDYEQACTFKVDDYGFFVYWKSPSKEGDVQELAQVCDIRYGGMPTNPKLLSTLIKNHGNNVDEKSLTICSGADYVNINYLHVICPDADTAKKWQQGLRDITHNNKAYNVCPRISLMKHWMRLRFLVNAKGQMPVKVITKTFASGKTEKLVYSSLAELGLPNGKGDAMDIEEFTFDKFYALYHKICPRNDIDELFQMITRGKDFVTLQQLVTFMNEKQRDPRLNEILYPLYSEKRCTEIINDYENNEDLKKELKISRDGMINYLMSDENAPVFLDRLDMYMDMDQPLAHYYVNSSHNTYLSGRQFGGKSTAEMYRQTLLAGCRCVELDCWDGKGEDEEPIITHGKAMCTDISYKEAIIAIRDCAFVTSDYPIILSFENHCCKSQQYKMAKYCDEIFGDLLLKEAMPGYPLEPGCPLPPPSAMKRKILIKNKRMKPDQEKAEMELFLKGQLVLDNEEKEDASAVAPPKDQLPDPNEPAAEGAPGAEGGPEGAAMPAHTGSTTNVHPWLSSMVNYAQPVKFQGFDAAIKKNIHHNMSSFAENAGMNFIKTNGIDFVNYNKRQISRIYPKGARVDSSNYMPQVFWNAGCQLVSLNFQTPDLPMQLNQGKFEYNGNCGYLLKPEFMRRVDRSFDPFAETSVDGVIAAQCSVQVIAGQFLSDKKVGTYVEVDMYGLPADTIRKEFRTRLVPLNGLNPVYNEDPFLFRKIVMPDLAVLRFGVFDENGKLLGQRILPLDGLQAGYRHISLRTEGNFPMALPMLFCNIELKIYVPDGLGDFMAALSDPKAFAKAQEQRDEQMKSMGIQDAKVDSKAAEAEKKKALEIKFEEITVESLRNEKGFAKVGKKQQKELETMRKKHLKERQTFQKNHTAAAEKLGKGRKPEEIMKDDSILKVVKEQTTQWSEMVERQLKEEWTMLKAHLKDSEELLKKLMSDAQLAQVKQLEVRLDKDEKDLVASQSKVSVETAKEVANDKTLKTKNDKDRRLKEKQQTNTKRFMEERKTAKIRAAKETEKLKKKHESTEKVLTAEIAAIIQLYEVEEVEFNMGAKNYCYV